VNCKLVVKAVNEILDQLAREQPSLVGSALLDRRESGHDIYARRGILTRAISTLTIAVKHFLSF
jgi:hypothetical protein